MRLVSDVDSRAHDKSMASRRWFRAALVFFLSSINQRSWLNADSLDIRNMTHDKTLDTFCQLVLHAYTIEKQERRSADEEQAWKRGCPKTLLSHNFGRASERETLRRVFILCHNPSLLCDMTSSTPSCQYDREMHSQQSNNFSIRSDDGKFPCFGSRRPAERMSS